MLLNGSLQIWVHIPADRSGLKAPVCQSTVLENTIEKKTMINLLSAYAVSVKVDCICHP